MTDPDEHFESILREATAAPPVAPWLWPGVHARLHAPAFPRFTPGFATSLAFALAAGIAIAFFTPPASPRASDADDLWTALGYGSVEGASPTLSAIAGGDR